MGLTAACGPSGCPDNSLRRSRSPAAGNDQQVLGHGISGSTAQPPLKGRSLKDLTGILSDDELAEVQSRSLHSFEPSGALPVVIRLIGICDAAHSSDPCCGLHLSGGTFLERYLSMFRLDAAPRYRLARPPLNQALVQVRFPVRTGLATMEGIAPIQRQLGTLFPYLKQQQLQQVSLLVGPGAPAAAETQTAHTWLFEDDVGWSLVLAPDGATLSIGPQYSEFREFSDRFSAVLSALSDMAGVPRADRLGVRYLNIVEIPPGDERVWRQWFRAELTGWSGTDLIGGATKLITSLTQTQLAAPPVGELSGPPVDIQAIVRHGVIPANTIVPGAVPVQPQRPAYLIDLDVFVEAPQPFDPTELSRQVTVFHDQIDRFFYWAMTDEGAAYFGCEVDRADDNSL